MSVRPRGNDDESPDAIEFGIAALDARLGETEGVFPASAAELVRELDDPRIPIDAHGNEIALSTALEEVPDGRFESERELLNALHPVFEAHRSRMSNGLLGSIRSLLPF